MLIYKVSPLQKIKSKEDKMDKIILDNLYWFIPLIVIAYIIWDAYDYYLKPHEEKGALPLKRVIILFATAVAIFVAILRLLIECLIWAIVPFSIFVLIVGPILSALALLSKDTMDIVAVLLFIVPFFIPLRDGARDALDFVAEFRIVVKGKLS